MNLWAPPHSAINTIILGPSPTPFNIAISTRYPIHFIIERFSKLSKDLLPYKAPGPDGFINDHYKLYADQLVCNTFNRFLSTCEIPSESLEAVLTTIHKPGKPSHDPANYSPISLLNTHLKLYTKLLATRLATYMPNLVHQRRRSTGLIGYTSTQSFRNLTSMAHFAKPSWVSTLYRAQEFWLRACYLPPSPSPTWRDRVAPCP